MGFIGALPSEVRRIIATLAPEIRRPVINVCAGNFTIPSILRSAGYAGDLYACDVTLYTSALGAYLTDRPLDLKIRPDAPATLAELLNIGTPAGAFASIALLYDLRQVWKMKNPFQARQVESYRRNWPALVAKLKAKLAAYKQHLAGVRYDPKDGFEVLQEASPEHHIFTAPPIYKGDYEKLDKLLTLCLEWTPPAYKPMLDTDLDIYRLIARFEGYAVVIYKDLPPVYEILGQPTAVIMPRGRGSNTLRVITRGSRRIVVRHQVKSEDVGPFLPASCSPTGREKVTLARITLGQSIRMNELFASARINTFTGGTAESVVFMLDGKIFGKADFCKSSHQWKFPDEEGFPPMIYLMSDLVVPNDTPRLAKLVLLCLLSSEVKQLLDIHFSEDFAYVGTTAFSAHAASMKYRGIFKMHKRMEDPNGYRLNYCCRFGGHSLQGALKSWMRKHKESK